MFKLQELVLDGNPICEKFNHESYVNEIKKSCPHIKRLVSAVPRYFYEIILNTIYYINQLDLFMYIYVHYYRRQCLTGCLRKMYS